MYSCISFLCLLLLENYYIGLLYTYNIVILCASAQYYCVMYFGSNPKICHSKDFYASKYTKGYICINSNTCIAARWSGTIYNTTQLCITALTTIPTLPLPLQLSITALKTIPTLPLPLQLSYYTTTPSQLVPLAVTTILRNS